MRSHSSRVATALISVLTCVASIPTAAHAEGYSVDTSGLQLPVGVTVASTSVSYAQWSGSTNACVQFGYTGNPTTVFFHDLQVDGSRFVGDSFIARQTVAVPTQPQNGAGLCVPIGQGDLTQSQGTVTLTSSSGETQLADQSTLAFPGSYTDITTKLTALGLTVTDAYMAWTVSADGPIVYDIYVDVTPVKQNTSITLGVSNQRLVTGANSTVALTNGESYPVISGPSEFLLGETTEDPMQGLGNVRVRADIVKAVPTKVTSAAKPPAGITLSADARNWYYDSQQNRTVIGEVMVHNSTKAPINIGVSGATLGSVAGTKTTNLKVKAQPVQYVTVPAKGDVPIFPFDGSVSGDARYNRTLSFNATIVKATPSSLDIKGLSVPKGYTVQPASFEWMYYDAQAKQTWMGLVVTQSAAAAAKVLVLDGLKVAGASKPKNVAAGGLREASAVRTFVLDLGTMKGDLRVGKTIVVTGKLTAAAPTAYTNDATSDNPETGIAPMMVQPPEQWDYDAAKRQTTIGLTLTNNGYEDATVDTCALSVSINGNSVQPIAGSVTVPSGGNAWLPIAKGAGDLRYGGHTVTVTGRYTTQGCG